MEVLLVFSQFQVGGRVPSQRRDGEETGVPLRVNDGAVGAPGGARAALQLTLQVANRGGLATGRRGFPELALRGEADKGALGRPEWNLGTAAAGNQAGLQAVKPA